MQVALSPGVVKVRLSGHEHDTGRLADTFAHLPGAEVVEVSAPYPNRRGPGVRVYLTLRTTHQPADETTRRDAGQPSTPTPGSHT